MRLSKFGIAIASLVASFASAHALPQPQVRAGILQCQGGQNVGFVVGSVTSLQCVFQSEGRRPEPYIATVRRFGLDLGVTDQTRLTWAVNAPTSKSATANLPAATAASAPTLPSASAAAAIFCSAVRKIPSRCSRSACRARSD